MARGSAQQNAHTRAPSVKSHVVAKGSAIAQVLAVCRVIIRQRVCGREDRQGAWRVPLLSTERCHIDHGKDDSRERWSHRPCPQDIVRLLVTSPYGSSA